MTCDKNHEWEKHLETIRAIPKAYLKHTMVDGEVGEVFRLDRVYPERGKRKWLKGVAYLHGH